MWSQKIRVKRFNMKIKTSHKKHINNLMVGLSSQRNNLGLTLITYMKAYLAAIVVSLTCLKVS